MGPPREIPKKATSQVSTQEISVLFQVPTCEPHTRDPRYLGLYLGTHPPRLSSQPGSETQSPNGNRISKLITAVYKANRHPDKTRQDTHPGAYSGRDPRVFPGGRWEPRSQPRSWPRKNPGTGWIPGFSRVILLGVAGSRTRVPALRGVQW